MGTWGRRLEGLTLAIIIYSVILLIVELEVAAGDAHSHPVFLWSEWFVAAWFTVEYVVRWVTSRSWRYPLRPMAIIDLLAILPFYLTLLVDFRSLRLLRLFRLAWLFKLYRYTTALESILHAFQRVRYEFSVIGFAIATLTIAATVLMYECEHEAQPETFAHLSDAAWCVIATITTVGYGDKVPVTASGKIVAAAVMIGGLGLYGTFVSLIGGAFLEELRARRQRHHRPTLPLFTLPPAAPGELPQQMHPHQILHDIEQGKWAARGAEALHEILHLLAHACRWILAEHHRPAGHEPHPEDPTHTPSGYSPPYPT